MTRRLQVGVVGIGFGQAVLVPAFQAEARCVVKALCASSPERAQAVASRLRIPRAYGDWREAVADPDLDILAIATPPSLQPAIVLAALAQGKHIFCEKPLATTLQDAAETVTAARRAKVAHMVDFQFPAIEEWQRAKSLLDSGSLGSLRHALVSWQVETQVNRLGLDSWKSRREEGGGTLNLFVSHTFHYLEWLLGPIQRLSAHLFFPGHTAARQQGDTLAHLCLLLEDGTPISVSVSSDAVLGSGHRLEIYGDRGALVLENPTKDYARGFRLLHGTRDNGYLELLPVAGVEPGEGDGRIFAVKHLVERFVNWIQQGIPANPNLEDGYRVQCLLEAANSAHATGSWVEVSREWP